MQFFDFAKHQKTIGKTQFWCYQKSWWKYLIKPVEFWWFWSPKRKMASKMIKKALGFSLKVDGVLRFREMLKKHWSWYILEHRKGLIKIPYETYWFLIISEPKTQIGLQNDQQSIRVFSKSWWRFTTSRNVEKHWS